MASAQKRDIVKAPDGSHHFEGDCPEGMVVAFVGDEHYPELAKLVEKPKADKKADDEGK